MEKARALMAIHILSQIDLAHKTAFCTVCGYTEIHVPDTYEESGSRIVCVQRLKELNPYQKMRRALSPEERKLARKQRHFLKEIDPELNRAICAICGPTEIHRHAEGGRTVYRCATYGRLANRLKDLRNFMQQPAEPDLLSEIYQKKKAVKGARLWVDLKEINLGNLSQFRKPKPRVSYLQEALEKKRNRTDENSRLVHEYRRTHTCKRCGSQAQKPGRLIFFEAHLPADQKISRLMPTLDLEALRVELEKRDLYCLTCYDRTLREYNKRAHRSAQISPAQNHDLPSKSGGVGNTLKSS
jgi:hypothetical protein